MEERRREVEERRREVEEVVAATGLSSPPGHRGGSASAGPNHF